MLQNFERPDMKKRTDALKVLVVEDSKVTLKVLCNFLERMDIKPLTAETGAGAIDVYRRERPDIILLDAQLPDIDGFEIASQIRAQEQKDDWTAIIFLTSMTKDADLAHGIEAGGDDYLMKPVSEVVLHAKVRAMRRLIEMQRSLVDVSHQLNAANKELQRLSTTDGLTGIANRRMFDELSIREWRRCERMKKPIALVMLDIDSFKLFNDHYGHQMGDECLRSVAGQVARAAPRAADLAARYGGEEFALVLGETDADGARWVAENVRQHVADLGISHVTPARRVTISCGVVSVLPQSGYSFETLLRSADRALYQAKKNGRDTVAVGAYGQV
ncbi:phytochrome-like protein cph2 [mine drainage metagenome]|uniref:Phytochrome-like protein cph2 n=1 Tax=mine drainage metagenome TaxID=410659 RepID=A0A1J5TFR1_9ZZZZ